MKLAKLSKLAPKLFLKYTTDKNRSSFVIKRIKDENNLVINDHSRFVESLNRYY